MARKRPAPQDGGKPAKRRRGSDANPSLARDGDGLQADEPSHLQVSSATYLLTRWVATNIQSAGCTTII
jgi:hypothetical protein